jgi:hypothetical protein
MDSEARTGANFVDRGSMSRRRGTSGVHLIPRPWNCYSPVESGNSVGTRLSSTSFLSRERISLGDVLRGNACENVIWCCANTAGRTWECRRYSWAEGGRPKASSTIDQLIRNARSWSPRLRPSRWCACARRLSLQSHHQDRSPI